MRFLLLVLIVILASIVGTMLGQIVWRWWLTRHIEIAASAPDRVDAVVATVCRDLGLPAHQLTDDYDLVGAGKMTEATVLVGHALGKDMQYRTVGDLKSWAREAPMLSSDGTH